MNPARVRHGRTPAPGTVEGTVAGRVPEGRDGVDEAGTLGARVRAVRG